MSSGTVSASEAYRRAGYSPKDADRNSARLMVKDRIKARIGYLQAKLAEKHEVTRESIAKEAEHIHQLAIAAGNLTAANGALVIKAKAYGLQTDKIVDDRASEAAKQLSEQERRDAEEFEQWKMRKRIKRTKAG